MLKKEIQNRQVVPSIAAAEQDKLSSSSVFNFLIFSGRYQDSLKLVSLEFLLIFSCCHYTQLIHDFTFFFLNKIYLKIVDGLSYSTVKDLQQEIWNLLSKFPGSCSSSKTAVKIDPYLQIF